MMLSAVTSHFRAADACTLVPRTGHLLWETVQLPHCSCPAAWREYAVLLENAPPEEWLRDATGTMGLWFDCAGWRVFRDAIDRLYLYLRQRDIPANGATLTPPVVQRRTAETDVPFLRAKSPLCVYVRIDYDRHDCRLELESGETTPLEPGALVLASGFRRHRIRGPGHVLHFQVQLPAVARTDALQVRSLHETRVLDTTVFAAATALPISEPIPSPELLMEKINWLHLRERRRHRHAECPAVRRFLINNEDPATATDEELRRVRSHAVTAHAAPDRSGLLQTIPMLSPEQCATLRQFAEDHMTSVAPDTVDDLPEYQVNLSPALLETLLGPEVAGKLLALPSHGGHTATPERIDIFLRMYSPTMRPYIAFHSDNCTLTANIALNDDSDFAGGRLLTINGDALQVIPRTLGSALVHCSQLVHGVSRIESGVRHTLILFFHLPAESAPTERA